VETGCDVCMLIQEQHIRVTNGQPLATDQTQGSGGRDNLNAQMPRESNAL
jgi:hypothetical protein